MLVMLLRRPPRRGKGTEGPYASKRFASKAGARDFVVGDGAAESSGRKTSLFPVFETVDTVEATLFSKDNMNASEAHVGHRKVDSRARQDK